MEKKKLIIYVSLFLLFYFLIGTVIVVMLFHTPKPLNDDIYLNPIISKIIPSNWSINYSNFNNQSIGLIK